MEPKEISLNILSIAFDFDRHNCEYQNNKLTQVSQCQNMCNWYIVFRPSFYGLQ